MKRILLALLLAVLMSGVVWSYRAGGIMNVLRDPAIESSTRLVQTQDYFLSWGPAAPGAYLLVVIVEVILAPIPGTLLYLPGGLIFGWMVGGTMSLAGNVLGAGIACQITRTIGRQRIERYLERPTLQKYLAVIEARGLWIVLLLRVNPFTSSDLVSYAAGLLRGWPDSNSHLESDGRNFVWDGTALFCTSLSLAGHLHGISPPVLSRDPGWCRLSDLCGSHHQTTRKVPAHISRVLISGFAETGRGGGA
jgi:uncharacterized membrane protein YdjX (TVP38/TMEM64 family)